MLTLAACMMGVLKAALGQCCCCNPVVDEHRRLLTGLDIQMNAVQA